MKAIYTHLMLCLMPLFSACFGQFEGIDFNDNSEMNTFPEITYEGKNVVACRVNGEIFISRSTDTWTMGAGPAFGIYYDTGLYVLSKDFVRPGNRSVVLSARYEPSKTEYKLSPVATFHSTQFIDYSYFGGRQFHLDTSAENHLKLLHLDDKIAVGTFAFTAVSEEGDTVRITDGRFDIARD